MTKTPDIYERSAPVSIDAERSILGAVLLDNAAYDEAELITYGDFALDSHKRIFAAMAELRSEARVIDIVTLGEELHRRHETEAVGGLAYIASLTEGLPRRLSILEYVRIVKAKAQARELITVCYSAIALAEEQSLEVSSLVADTDSRLMTITADSTVDTESLAQASRREFGLFMQELQDGKPFLGLPTGLQVLDSKISGWVEGELSILAGRPGQGKSSVLVQTLIRLGLDKIPAHCFAPEMTTGQMLRRMWAGVASLKYGWLRHPRFLPSTELGLLREAEATVARFPLIIDPSTDLTAAQLCSRARLSKRKNGTRFVGVDYLQKLHFDSAPDSRHIAVSDGAVKLANLAKQEHLAVLVLSSLTEKSGRGRNLVPTLADLRQSGDIQYEASTVVLIHREVNDASEQLDADGVMVIAKQRNGETGQLAVHYTPSLMFESGAKAQPQGPQQYAMTHERDGF
jgi:replicative DNA helicase